MGDLRGGTAMGGYVAWNSGNLNPDIRTFGQADIPSHTNYIGTVLNMVAGQTIGMHNAVVAYSGGAGTAMANAEANVPAIGVSIAGAGAGGAVGVLVNGLIRNTGWAWGKGGLLYLSPTVSGGFTQTRPSAAGQIVQIIGVAIETNVIYVNPQWTWVTI